MFRKNLLFIGLACSFAMATAQSKFKSGPMLGHVDLREAILWVQTNEEAKVTVYYWAEGDTAVRQVSEETTKEHHYTTKLYLTDLEPATVYHYTFNNPKYLYKSDKPKTFKTQTLWQWRTDPPNFRMAAGSCAYVNETKYDRPGEPYGGDMSIFDTIASKKPDMMLWLGDNIYLREGDFTSRSGIIHRYDHTRSQPAMSNLLTTCPNYAIWDDHDFGPNDANGSYPYKDWTYQAFQDYWANPTFGIPSIEDGKGITTAFQFCDIDFFLLDNRYHRVAAEVQLSDSITILGDDQIDWLIQALSYSKAPFKIIAVGGQFLNTEPKFETFSTVPSERKRILDAIEKNNIKGVVFVSGDRHCAELSELKLGNGQMVYDLTSSPLTSKAYDISKENNTLRVPGTLFAERNFTTFDFSGPRNARILTIRIWDNKGKEIWKKEIMQAK